MPSTSSRTRRWARSVATIRFLPNRGGRFFGTIRPRPLDWGRRKAMAKFRVKNFGRNDVPVDLIKPILDEIDAELVIARPANDAEVIEMVSERAWHTMQR